MLCRNVSLMRRKGDSYLNATQILKVAGIDKGKRTKILEKEIASGTHEKVQGGYGKYQGTWIPFERGLQLAKEYGVDELMQSILAFDPSTFIATNKPPSVRNHTHYHHQTNLTTLTLTHQNQSQTTDTIMLSQNSIKRNGSNQGGSTVTLIN
ncbi:transcriptional regulator swi6, partial [Coelomomyces lativittatus]